MANQVKSYQNSDQLLEVLCNKWEERIALSNPTLSYRQYQNDILGFFSNELHIEPDPDQAEILLAIQRAANGEGKRQIAIRSGHGTGKTKIICAGSAIWYTVCFDESKVITTAPTWPQVEYLIWPDIHTHLNTNTDLRDIFDLKQTQITLKGKPAWYAVGRNSNKPENITGFHGDHLLLIVDECAGVDEQIINAAFGALTTDTMVIVVSNPVIATGFFYDCFHKNREDWDCFHLNSETSPWVTKDWLEKRYRDWDGPDGIIYQARVKGNFPEMSDDQLISLQWIEEATKRGNEGVGRPFRYLGVDVASMGADKTVITPVDYYPENKFYNVIAIHDYYHNDPTEVSAKVEFHYKQYECNKALIDATGIGDGVESNCRHAGLSTERIMVGSRALYNPDTMMNLKSEIFYSNLRPIFREGRISIPFRHAALEGDLVSYKYEIKTDTQKLHIIDAKKKRSTADIQKGSIVVNKSPDFGDSLALACFGPIYRRQSFDEETQVNLQQAQQYKYKQQYNKYRGGY